MFKKRMRWYALVIGLVFLGSGIVSLKDDIHDWKLDHDFSDHGKSASLIQASNYTETDVHRPNRDGSPGGVAAVSKTADLVFRTASGELVTIPQFPVSTDLVDRVNRQIPVYLDYLPENPQEIRLEHKALHSTGGTVASLVMLVIGLVLLFSLVRAKK